MILSLDIRRARKGDCLLLHFGTEEEPALMLIDGGPSGVYLPFLRPRLDEIKSARGIPDAKPLFVDVLMVSHVDDDHIKGILDLTRELLDSEQPFVHITEMWHNTFDSIIDNDPADLTANVKQFGTASVAAMAGGELPPDVAAFFEGDREREAAEAGAMVLASIAQGHQLRNDATKLEIQLNTEFDPPLVMAGKKAVPLGGLDDVTVTVAGPRKGELAKLQKKHDEWLKQLKKEGKKPPAALAAYLDESVPNLASIVGLVKCNKKTILLTGDARGDNILSGLEEVGLLKKNGTMRVDILKVPHHGSSNNLDNDFFERILADHYVFSGNGQHGNPERELLEMLLDARKADPFTIHFTYPVAEIDPARKQEWDNKRKEEIKKKKKNPRAPWDADTHSLAALFKQRPLKAKQKLVIVPEEGAHVIDLLDPLGF